MTGYERMVAQLRELVCETVPAGELILVVSRGDGHLLDLPGRRAGHFPQSPGGMYAGHHPADGRAAVDELVRLRSAGARYLVFPDTGRWWLEHYGELPEWLSAQGQLLADRDGAGIVYGLDPWVLEVTGAASTVAPHIASLATALLPPEAPLAVLGPPGAGSQVRDRLVTELPPGSPWPADELNVSYAAVVAPADPVVLPAARRLICHRHALDLYRIYA